MNDKLNERQSGILDYIASRKEVRISELKNMFPVTEMTIRRDLEKLEATGMVRRTFGGAIFLGKDIDLTERAGLLAEEKSRIGHYAAKLVRTGESIFIDGGTTTSQVAKHLPEGLSIQVVTNSLTVAAECLDKHIPVVMVGGMLIEATKSLVGPLAVQGLNGMIFDRIFLGATGFTPQYGFSNSNMYEAEIKQLAIRQTKETTIVLDHTKFGATNLLSFASLAQVNRITTDKEPDIEVLQQCEKAEVEVAVAT